MTTPPRPHVELVERLDGLANSTANEEADTIRQAADAITELSGEVERLSHLLDFRTRQAKLSGDCWQRDAEAALAGDPRALRNRIELRKLGPVEIIQSAALSSITKDGG